MTAEFDRQVKAVGWHIPAHADKPGSVNEEGQSEQEKTATAVAGGA
jgi:hypothetical protein